jgi:hypothetical protein
MNWLSGALLTKTKAAKEPFGVSVFVLAQPCFAPRLKCCLSILSRQALERGNLRDMKQLREAINHFIAGYGTEAVPFDWRQSDIKQQPLRDNRRACNGVLSPSVG